MIQTINVNQLIKESKSLGPIKTHQIYFDKSMNYHPQGLYSEEIFGMDGSKDILYYTIFYLNVFLEKLMNYYQVKLTFL